MTEEARPEQHNGPEQIARICHEAVRTYNEIIGDPVQPHWADAPGWMRESAVNSVNFHLALEASARDSHDSWMREKLLAGWRYGKTKDDVALTHPCLLPYSSLPPEQKRKDFIFSAVVEAFIARETDFQRVNYKVAQANNGADTVETSPKVDLAAMLSVD